MSELDEAWVTNLIVECNALREALRRFVERSPTTVGDRDCGSNACLGCGSFCKEDEAYNQTDIIEHEADCPWVAARALLAHQEDAVH